MEAVVSSFVENFLTEIVLLLLVAFVGYFIGLLKGKSVKVNIKVDINRMEEEKKKKAKKGMILIVSRYTSHIRAEASDIQKNNGGVNVAGKLMKEDEIKRELEQKNYQVFNFEISNFGHNIMAILAHSAKLEHCWIVGSYAKDSSSVISISINFEETFIEYLKQEKGLKCEFHYGKQYAIPMDDDALICEKVYELANDIFIEAKKHHKLTPKDIIVDVTGGTKSMNLGLTLASLHKDRDIQVIGSDYDENGRPAAGKSYPVRIHFKPKVRS